MAYVYDDILVRISKLKCCISEKAQELVKKRKYGVECDSLAKQVQVLSAYQIIINSYDVDSSNNLISESDLDNIFDNVSRICQMGFATEGYQYDKNDPLEPDNDFIELNSGPGDNLVLNDGATDVLLNTTTL